jgi:O-antigen biosynthesis protein
MTASGRAAQQPMRVLALAAEPASTITEIRITTPLAALVAAGHITLRTLPWHACEPTELNACELLIGQRPTTSRHLRLLRTAHERGAAVVVDIDDLLTRPAPHLLAHDVLARQAPWIEQALDEADRVSVSTARLAQALASPGRHFRLVPNYAWPGARAGVARKAGATAHVLLAASEAVADCAAFDALRRLQCERGARLRTVAVGPVAGSAIAAGLSVEALPLMPRARFLDFAASLDRAVAVIPLDASAFSAGKSAIKWFDLAAAGLPALMSDRPPYSDVVEHGRTGWLLADDPTAWADALKQALDDHDLRAQVAAHAAQAVRERHTLAHTTAAWRALIDELAAARATGQVRRRTTAWYQCALAPWHNLALALRRANRQRLARRKPPPGAGGGPAA